MRRNAKIVAAVAFGTELARETACLEECWGGGTGGEDAVVSPGGYLGGMSDDDVGWDGGDGGSPDLDLNLERESWELGECRHGEVDAGVMVKLGSEADC